MTHIGIMWDTKHRTASWTASSAKATLPASHLGTDDLAQEWQTAESVDSAYFVADAGASFTFGGLVLLDPSCNDAATLRVRVSTSDATGEAGDALDSGNINAFDPQFRHWTYLASPQVTGRYVRVDISNAGQPRLGATGCAFGPVWYPDHNIEIGVEWSVENNDLPSFSRSGAESIDEAALRRVLRARLPAVTTAEHDAQLQVLAVRVSNRRPVLMVRNPGAAALGPESIYGRIRTPLGFPNSFMAADGPRYGWQFEVGEMLR